MTHWGWYWKVKRKHIPKALCSQFINIDSFEMFKNKALTKMFMNKIVYEIPRYNLKITLLEDKYQVHAGCVSYIIPIEKKSCNYGGFRYFFRCPSCNTRMRKLYCEQGFFLCRKCLKLGYYTQRLRPSQRCLIMGIKIKDQLKNKAGSLERKPPWMKFKTHKLLKSRYNDYNFKYTEELTKELKSYYPSKAKWFQF